MNLFDVYPLLDVEPARAEFCNIFDNKGVKYLDLYGGHAVISIGHTHPSYVFALEKQLNKIAFYSNAVINPLQKEFAKKLGEISGYNNYSLFLCNSGAEANENALKLASFHTGKSRVLAFKGAFHGRTSGAVAVTDIPAYISEFNKTDKVTFVELGDIDAVKKEFSSNKYCSVIIEGIQGVSGVVIPSSAFFKQLRELCDEYNVKLIVDEIQSGCGRSGKYFYHQYADIQADLVTVAKGIGNGFPLAGVLISPDFKATKGCLGTTFGGNHLACAAGISVIEVMQAENLIENAGAIGDYLISELKKIPEIKEVRGKGLMIGIVMDENVSELRKLLLNKYHIFTGVSGANIIRLLPPLCLNKEQVDIFLIAFKNILK